MRAIAVIAVLGVVAVATAQQASLKPIATTGEVMEAVVVPSSTAVFRAASEAPSTDEGWVALRGQALVLAESGNLLMIGSRVRDAREWMTMAAAMRDAAAVTVKAVDARNAEALSDASDRVYDTCEQCHDRYMQPSQP